MSSITAGLRPVGQLSRRLAGGVNQLIINTSSLSLRSFLLSAPAAHYLQRVTRLRQTVRPGV